MSDWEDVDSSEWEDVPSEAGFLDYLGATGKRTLANLADASGGLDALTGDVLQGIEDYTGLPLGQYGSYSRARAQGLRSYADELNQEVDQSIPEGLGKRIVDIAGGTIPAVATLPLGPIPAGAMIGLQSTGRKYGDLTDPENPDAVDGPTAAASAFGSGVVDAGLSAVPLSFIGKSTGPLLRRWLLESAKVGGANAAITPLQVAGNAAVDSMTLGTPMDAESLGAQTRRGVEDSLLSAPLWGLMGATAGGRRAPQQDLPVFTADDMLSQMAADAPPPPPPADGPTLALPDSPNQVAGLLPYDRSWVPESYQPGQDFLFRDYAALPPMDISQPQQALSSTPPDSLSWQFRQLDPSDQVFTPDQPLQIGFDGFPQSEMPSWELSPNYQRGDNFQYREYAALPPMDVSQPQRALSSVPPDPLSWQFRQLDSKSQTLAKPTPLQIGFDGPSTPPTDSNPTPIKITNDTFPKAISEIAADAPQQSLFDAPAQPVIQRAPVERYGTDLTPPLWTELSPRAQAENLPTFILPLDQVILDPEIPNFKADAGPTGEVKGKELSGEYNRAVGPIIVMRRMSRPQGPFSVLTGRHRRGLKERLGEQTIEVKIIDESPTFGVREAQALDAELNILDGQGTITDYANYFNKSGMNEQEASKRGLLSREEGRTGYNIGMKATENVWAAWRSGAISDRLASTIANAAPLNEGLQAEGLRLASKGKAQYAIEGALRFLQDFDDKAATSGVQGDMFGSSATIQQKADLAVEIEAVKKELQGAIIDELRSFEAAAKRPDLAAKRIAFKGKTPDQLLQEADKLRIEAAKYGDEIYLWPDKLAEVKAKAEQRILKGDDLRADTAQRIANKKRRPVTKREVLGVEINQQGGFGADWVLKLFMKDPNKDLPDFEDQSKTNRDYAKVWRKTIEWMDTTKTKAPQSAEFINSYWKVPQDLNSIVYDAKLTLEPYLDLTAQERVAVDSYLAAARVQGRRDPSYKVSPETAAKVQANGKPALNEKQIQAAVAVNRWSNEMLNVLEDHAVRVAEHAAFKKKLSLPTNEARATIDTNLKVKLEEIRNRFGELKNSNYVPFNRYGEYFINVFDKDGNLAHRYQFESKSDPEYAKTVNHFKSLVNDPNNEVSGGKIRYGRSDPPKLNERDGVPSDILELLNDDGVDGEVRGFYKHLKPAALVKGFNPDILRSVSEYTTGAAKLISMQRAKMAGERELLTTLRGPENTNLVRRLQAWADGYNEVGSPIFQAVNKAMNVAYIGGNLRTPTADMLGRIQLQYPLLAKYTKGFRPEAILGKGIYKELRWWFSSDESFAKSNPELSAGIREAQRKGIIPTNIYKTFLRNAKGQSKGASKLRNQIHDLYFGLKEISERSTDLGGFILGWEAYPYTIKGKKQVYSGSRQQFAEDFVRESRAVPTQAELPAGFRLETVRLATKYRLYQAKILKSLTQAGLGQWARYLTTTGLTTGVAGTIFMRDAFNAARFGGVEPEDKLREAGFGPATMYGPLSAATGIDFSGTAGFGEVFPGSGGNMASKFLLGMIGAPFEAMTRAYNYYERGQNNKAIGSLPFMPNTVSNFLTQKDWGERGVVTLGGKAVIPRDEVEGVDRFKKLLGYQPLRVKEAMVLENRKKQAANTGRATGFYNQRIGEALGLGNLEEAQALAQQAQEEGVKLNSNSVKEYVAKIQGRDGKIPKRARGEVRRVEDLYGQAIRD